MKDLWIGWGITFRGDLIHSSIRMLRKFAIEDYVGDVDMPGGDWKQCMRDGCQVVKVFIYKRPLSI
jgi:hypothetical protein